MGLFDMFKKTAPQPQHRPVSAVPAGAPAADLYSYRGPAENYFYELLRGCFPICEIRRNVTAAQLGASASPTVSADSWTCGCGSVNNGGFCPECGAKKPAPKVSTAASGSWKCSCGAENTGKFCPECGAPRPDAGAAQPAPKATSAVSGGDCAPITFLLLQGGQPKVAVILCSKRRYDTDAILNTIELCQSRNIAVQRYFPEFRNEAAYVCGRISKALR